MKRLWPFWIDALVVLPDYLHTIWTLPEGDTDFSKRWRAIKARFTRRSGIVLAHDRRGEYELWQRHFWKHLVRDEKDFPRHVDYIHYRPIKHGWVARPLDWRWSGLLPPDWAGVPEEGGFGE